MWPARYSEPEPKVLLFFLGMDFLSWTAPARATSTKVARGGPGQRLTEQAVRVAG